MPVSKTYLYPKDFNSAATIMQALGHGARLCIIQYLKENGMANNKELVEYLGLCQSTVSGHLRVLKEAEVIIATQYETSVFYQINTSNDRKGILRSSFISLVLIDNNKM